MSPPGRRHDPGERDGGYADGNPHQNDFGEGGANGVAAEEDPRPCQVEGQLYAEENEGAGALRRAFRLGDLPSGEGHQQVEGGPDRGEDPTGRIEPRLEQAAVPGGDFGGRPAAAEQADCLADDDPENQACGAHLNSILPYSITNEIEHAQAVFTWCIEMARLLACRVGLAGPRSGRGRREEAEILALPDHGGVDAVVAAGMVEEDPFLDGAGAHLAVLAEVDRRLGDAIGLSRGGAAPP